MLTAIQGTYDNGQIIWDETPPTFSGPVNVIVTFLVADEENSQTKALPKAFEHLFPYLHRWVDLGNEVRLGQDSMYYSQALVSCFDEGGTIYESPADVANIQRALELANVAIREWLEENMPDELDD